jgi:hypothetical protein
MTGNKLISEITLLKMKQFSLVCGARIAGRGIITGSGNSAIQWELVT